MGGRSLEKKRWSKPEFLWRGPSIVKRCKEEKGVDRVCRKRRLWGEHREVVIDKTDWSRLDSR